MNTPIVPLDGEGDQTILFEICPEINKTVSKKKKKILSMHYLYTILREYFCLSHDICVVTLIRL